MALSIHDVFRTDSPPAVLIVRLAVGYVFFAAGLSKLVDVERATESFRAMGFGSPEVVAPFVGMTELLCALLVLAGFATRLAAVPLIIIMLTALFTTKLPILLGAAIGPFGPPSGNTGLIPFLVASRLDMAMLLSSIFLLVAGSGPLSIDRRIGPRMLLHDHQLRQTAHFPTGERRSSP